MQNIQHCTDSHKWHSNSLCHQQKQTLPHTEFCNSIQSNKQPLKDSIQDASCWQGPSLVIRKLRIWSLSIYVKGLKCSVASIWLDLTVFTFRRKKFLIKAGATPVLRDQMLFSVTLVQIWNVSTEVNRVTPEWHWWTWKFSSSNSFVHSNPLKEWLGHLL